MFAGAAIIFFAYIGFDSVSVHSEEARQPERDVPIGIIVSLIVCTVLYIAVTAVLTGMMPNDQIDRDAAFVVAFQHVGLTWMQYLVAAGAMMGITSVLLVMMLSQPSPVELLWRHSSALPHPLEIDHSDRDLCRPGGGVPAFKHLGRDDQHRHPVRLCDRLCRGAGDAQDAPGRPSALPGSFRSAGAHSGHCDVPVADVLPAGGQLVPVDHLAADRDADLLLLRPPSQRHGQTAATAA
jgi:hypothetical protein